MSDFQDSPPPPPVYNPPPAVPPPVAAPAGRAQDDLNPWFSIWIMPRATMRQILDTNPRRLVHVLAILGGIIEAMGSHIPRHLLNLDLGPIVAIKIVSGVCAGLLVLYLASFMLWMTGKWVGGLGSFVAVRAVVGWSNVPRIWIALLWLPLLAYMGTEALNFDPERLLEDPSGLLLMIPIGMMAVAAFVWRFIILLKCLGEAHGFTAWHSFGAVIITVVLLGIPIVMLAAVVFALFGMAGLHGLSS